MSLQTNYTGAVHSQLSTGDDPALRLMTPMLTEDPTTPESRHSRNNSHPSHRLRLSYLGKKKKKDNISQVIWKATVGSDYNLSKAAEVSMVMWRMVIFPSIKKNNFIYLFLAVLDLHCHAQAFSSCGKQGLLSVAVHGLLIAAASPFAENRL